MTWEGIIKKEERFMSDEESKEFMERLGLKENKPFTPDSSKAKNVKIKCIAPCKHNRINDTNVFFCQLPTIEVNVKHACASFEPTDFAGLSEIFG